MKKIKMHYKIIPMILVVSILFTACKIPDISEFTEASATMTQAIRLGVSETDKILEDASKRDDLFGEETASIQESLKRYREATAPTLKTLKGLDAYLEALNALATAQKNSRENAEGAVTSVANLAAEVNAIKIPETAIKLGTGLLALAEALRTERDFKKRVKLTERIVNGASGDGNQTCTQNTFELMEEKTRMFLNNLPNTDTATKNAAILTKLKEENDKLDSEINKLRDEKKEIERRLGQQNSAAVVKSLNDRKTEIDEEINALEKEKEAADEKAERKRDDLYNNAFVKLNAEQRTALDTAVGSNSCGIIDLLKINVRYLRKIYNSVATNLYRKTSNKHRILINYHDNIVANDTNVQRELTNILLYNQRVLELSQYQNTIDLGLASNNNESKQEIEKRKKRIEEQLASVYITNNSLEVIIKKRCQDDAACRGTRITEPAYQQIIKGELNAREVFLLDLNKRYTDDLQRIDPAYTKVMANLKQIRDKHQQMLKVFDGSLEALDTWGETHSNLRDSLTTKRPFTAARLFSDARFILSLLNLGEAES